MSWHNRAEYIAFRIAVGGLKVMPDQWSVNVCRAMAYLAGPVFGLRKRTVVDQLSAIFQDQSADDIEKLMKAVYDHLGRSVSETFCVSEDALIKSVAVTPGWGGLDKAVSGGGGAIVVTAHMGNFELGGRALAQRYSVLDVIKPMRNPIFGKYLDRERSRHGIATVPMDDSGRAVLQHLRDGGVVTLLLDQDAGKDGVRIDFLGRPASAWTGAARLALRTGCPIIPVAIVRNERSGHTLHIGEAVSVAGLGGSEGDTAELMQRCSQAVEQFIYEHPAQWFWVHRRWKGANEAQTV